MCLWFEASSHSVDILFGVSDNGEEEEVEVEVESSEEEQEEESNNEESVFEGIIYPSNYPFYKPLN